MKPGDKIYLRRNDKPWAWAYERTYQGETNRSWLCDSEWQREKYAKSKYTVITEQEYREWRWADETRYQIGATVQNCTDPAILRQIAELIGYKEPK